MTYLTYCRVASQFTVCDASAAFSILAESSLHCFLSFASSVILTRSSVEWSLKWSISPRSLFSTIGRVVVGRPLSLWCFDHFDRESYRLFGEPRAHRQQVSAMLSCNIYIYKERETHTDIQKQRQVVKFHSLRYSDL